MSELAIKTQTDQAARSTSRNKNALRAIMIPVLKQQVEKASDEPGQTKAQPEDPFSALADGGEVITPPFDLLSLAVLNEHSTELTPIVDTMETNIDGFGYHLRCRLSADKVPKELKNEVLAERVRLTNFFEHANLRDSLTRLRRKRRRDLEMTGNAYWELIRSAGGRVQGFEHLPSYQMRLSVVEPSPIKIEIPVLELRADGSYEVDRIPTWCRFRRFVQSRLTAFGGMNASASGSLLRWFKEFGDPRIYDNETGKVVPDEKVKNWDGKGNEMPESRRANEVEHWDLYSTRSPYGLPRFIGNLLSIYGARAAEEINYITFRNNNIPSMFVLVSNGQLTDASITRIESFVESAIQGSDNYSKFLIVEAEGELEGEDAGNVKLDVKPMTSEQIHDALFQDYTHNCQKSIRRAFRVPPIFISGSEEYSRNVAETSRRLADEQVFAPERDDFDDFINRRLFPEMGVKYHTFKSNSPNTTDNAELVRILSGAEKTGGMTPRIARTVLEDILGAELPPFPKDGEFNPDLPFSLLMAEAVKNQADASEPGQQVTALKSLMGWDESELTEETLALVEVLRGQVEKLWNWKVSQGET